MSRHYVVIGGSRGLGRSFAETLVTDGERVSIISRSGASMHGTEQRLCDLRSPDESVAALEAIVREHGSIDALAFFQRYRGPGDDWADELAVSLTATKVLIDRSVDLFTADGLRSIAVVSSVNARFISPHITPGYHVAKAGLCQLARYYACKLGPLAIRVNAVCPSTFLKPENESFYASRPDVVARLSQLSPLNRMATHFDVHEAVRFLLSERAAFITGQVLTVDGGISLKWQETLG